jgi:hypothetical protein
MSAHHDEFCDLVERLALGEGLSEGDRALLEEYASPLTDASETHPLDGSTVEMVASLTGRRGASCPKLAARALLVTVNLRLARRLGPSASTHTPLTA